MKFRILILICTGLFLVGCKSAPVKKEVSDFCGIVIDENNMPVENFVIQVNGKTELKKTGVTNSEGIFVVSDVNTGIVKISGFKDGYAVYENSEVEFFDRTKMFCIQVNSCNVILDKVEKYISLGEMEKAEKELSEIYCSKHKILRTVLDEYKKIIGENK